MAAKKAVRGKRKTSVLKGAKRTAGVKTAKRAQPAKSAKPARPAKSASTRLEPWRATLAAALDWRQAHATLDDAIKDLSPTLHGRRPDGLVHSPWELLAHIRLTQADLLRYMEDPKYSAPEWPRDYWPPSAEPPNAAAWDATVDAIHRDIKRLNQLVVRPSLDLTANIPWGEDHSYLRTILVAIDHMAYHVAEIVDARRVLGAWGS